MVSVSCFWLLSLTSVFMSSGFGEAGKTLDQRLCSIWCDVHWLLYMGSLTWRQNGWGGLTCPDICQFSSVQEGIYTFRKARLHSSPSRRSFPSVETVPVMVCLTMALSLPFKDNCSVVNASLSAGVLIQRSPLALFCYGQCFVSKSDRDTRQIVRVPGWGGKAWRTHVLVVSLVKDPFAVGNWKRVWVVFFQLPWQS